MNRKPIPYKRSTVIEEKIVADIRQGATLDGAALGNGIHPVTFLRWRRCEAEPESTGRDDRCWDCRGCRLQEKVDAALESYKSVLLRRVADATDKNGNPVWQASAWLLERRFRDEFGQKTVTDATHRMAGPNVENARKLAAAILGAAIAE